MAAIKSFTTAELLVRASERVVYVMRQMDEEKGSSHSRLLDDPLLPTNLITVGRSRACSGNGYREHVVPCCVIIKECHQMVRRDVMDGVIATFIRENTKIVRIAKEEAERLNRKQADGTCLRNRMPEGWVFGDDIYARLAAAEIAWDPFEPAQ